MIARLLLCLSLVAFSAVAAAQPPARKTEQKLLPLQINGHGLNAMIARTDPERRMGLMLRTKLAQNEGMLFLYPREGIHSMWMKNTNIPLSVAFIDRNGVIINIEDMQPHTLNGHAARAPAKYSLEVNQGWFAQRKIGPGAKILGLEKAPPAE